MKRARDDAITMGDNNSYPLREEEVDDEEEDHDQQERAARDVLLSLSCCSSSTSGSEEAPAGTAAPPLNKNKHRRRHHHRRGQAVFECRTCGQQFTMFQALGGHRTSHFRRPAAAKKLRPKAVAVVHACGMCGLRFSMGQALGGHMRRHRGLTTTTTTANDSAYLGLTRIIVQERPSSASLQLLNLFV
ncbi:unnamed protein product [Urochloa decumbens]|uniref:C2H2-type domain-containing protein n=1 Tax=Urochloa decumbens TaxID=240449 RepID=A0ABC9H6T5_9POAL